MDWLIVGLAAGALTSTAFIPQIVRGLRTRHLQDVSPAMLLVFLAGLALWLVYGIAQRDVPLIASNAVALACTTTLLLLWIRWGRPRAEAAQDPKG